MNPILIAEGSEKVPGPILFFEGVNISSQMREGGFPIVHSCAWVSVVQDEVTTPVMNRDMGERQGISLWSRLATPQTFKTAFIQDLGDPRVTLLRSIPVSIDFWPDHVTACSFDIEEFGIGADEFEAVSELKASLADLYFLLKNEQGHLGPLPQKQWDFLRGIIREA